MDRTTELKNDYEAMQGLIERFQHRQTLRVIPDANRQWYLLEKEGHSSWIEQFDSQMVAYMQFHWGKRGWTMTPIDIFRTS